MTGELLKYQHLAVVGDEGLPHGLVNIGAPVGPAIEKS
jgi:hypothetical protein